MRGEQLEEEFVALPCYRGILLAGRGLGMTVKEVVLYGILACAVWSLTEKLVVFCLLRLLRCVAPRLGRRAKAWAQRFDEYCSVLMNQPALIALHHIKFLQASSVMNWATIVAMAGLIIYAIHGAWTILSSALFVVGLIYYVANYLANCYQLLVLRGTAARLRAVTGKVTPGKELQLLLAMEMTERLALIALLTGKTTAETNSDTKPPPPERTETKQNAKEGGGGPV